MKNKKKNDYIEKKKKKRITLNASGPLGLCTNTGRGETGSLRPAVIGAIDIIIVIMHFMDMINGSRAHTCMGIILYTSILVEIDPIFFSQHAFRRPCDRNVKKTNSRLRSNRNYYNDIRRRASCGRTVILFFFFFK